MGKQDEVEHLLRDLEGYKPRNLENIFPLPKNEMTQHEEWAEEEKGK